MQSCFVDDLHNDVGIGTLEGCTCFRRSRCTFTSPHDNHRSFQTTKRFLYIQVEMVAQKRSDSETAVRLVGTGVEILNQFISNQARIVIALLLVVAANSLTGGKQIIDKLPQNWCAQEQLP